MIRTLKLEDAPALQEFLAEVSTDQFFQPNIDPVEVCTNPGRDVYCAAFIPPFMIGLGMLRGRNDGFEHFSLGIVVSSRHRSQGIGGLMMMTLHALAKMNGETRIRLRVHPDNKIARRMYESQGYVFSGELDRDELVGWKEL